MIHLDTSFLIRAFVLKSTEDARLRSWLRGHEILGMSTIAWAEFLCGPVDTSQVELASRVIAERVPVTEADAVLAAHLFNLAGRRRGTLVDSLIAATAIRAQAALATANVGDFRRFAPGGLEIVSS